MIKSNASATKGQFNFVWLFAILVGAAILFLALYGASKIGDTANLRSSTKSAKAFSILTDPLQAGFSEGSFASIIFPGETRIRNICFDQGFGTNDISIATRANLDGKWTSYGTPIRISNKYLFSEEVIQGTEYYTFSKPFELPYKTADLIFLTSKNYCFSNSPAKVSKEILDLKIPNIEVNNCTLSGSTKVCFGTGENCDILVTPTCGIGCNSEYDEGIVSHGSVNYPYINNLLYAAIFSGKESYECNVNRLLYRAEQISQTYIGKSDLLNSRDCGSNIKSDLIVWEALLQSASLEDLGLLNDAAKNIQRKESRELCGLW